MTERIYKLDIAKGIGITLVVYAHTFTLPIVHDAIFLFHIPLFFIVSGYLYNEIYSIKETIFRKIQSLVVPYVFFMVLGFAIALPLYKYTGILDHLSIGILIHPWGVVGPLWFFLSLFFVSIIFKIIDQKVNRELHKFLIVFILFFMGLIFSHSKIRAPFYLDSSLTALVFYAIGYELKKYPSLEKWLYAGGILYAVFCIASKQFPQVDLKSNVFSNPFCFLLSSALSCIIIRFSGYLEKIQILKSAFTYLGGKTLIIFPLHMLAFEILYIVFPENNYLSAIIVSALSIAIILIINKLFNFDSLMNDIRIWNIYKYLDHILKRFKHPVQSNRE